MLNSPLTVLWCAVVCLASACSSPAPVVPVVNRDVPWGNGRLEPGRRLPAEDVTARDCVHVAAYTRADGTRVRAHVRCK